MDERWSATATSFYDGRFWIGFAGPLENYPVRSPQQVKQFLSSNLAKVPREVFNQRIMRLRFTLDPGLFNDQGHAHNPVVKQAMTIQDDLLNRFNITPEREVEVRLVDGDDDAAGRLSHDKERGFICTVGRQSGFSAGFLDYMNSSIQAYWKKEWHAALMDTFHTTRWTLVQQSRGDDTASQQALSDLCAIYYTPVFVFIRRSGFEEVQARDLAHDFFTHWLSAPEVLKPQRERGRFRSYLLGAVKHFVSDSLDKARAKKRGAGVMPESITEAGAALADAALTPDLAFDRQWALTVLDHVLQALADEFAQAGKADHFALLKPWLTGDEGESTQAEIAQQLGMNEGALKVAIHRLRKRFRELIRTEIAHTVGTATEAREELSYLLSVM